MKTRIISGIVMIALLCAFLTAGKLVSPLFITALVAFIAAVGIYELLRNAAGIKLPAAVAGACVFSVLYIVFTDNSVRSILLSLAAKDGYNGDVAMFTVKFYGNLSYAVSALTVGWFVYAAVITLVCHKAFGLAQIAALFGFPLPYAAAFGKLSAICSHSDGIYYLLLLLNFSSVCDMGAYFVGSAVGKHKLCPEISPHKTVEGAVGGIVSSIIVTVVLGLCFNKNLAAPALLTVPLCVLGMVGDLFASAIKRAAGIKDYGNLIPGHGGIMDRVDSIIMIAPVLHVLISFGVI